MARIGIAITKSTPFRNSVQEFSNVYYYDGLAGTPTEAEAESLIDEQVVTEKTVHSTAVTFVRGRCWLQAGTPGANIMLKQKNLSGTGSMPQVTSMDKERAYLFRLRAGVDSRGNPVYLRKWFHVCGEIVSGQTPSAGVLTQASGWSTAERSAQVAKMADFGNIGSGGTLGVLCAKNGRTPTAGANWEAHAFLEHRQLGDMWRAQ
jgi:hypothetical protein